MSRALLCVLLVAALALGCRKHEPAPGAKATPDEATPSPGAPPPHGAGSLSDALAATVVPDNGDVDATLHQLSVELRKYVVRTHNVPRDFDDFIAKARVQAPPPPAGKKYAIQGQVIVLVKQ
jgi:hypothetical protein